MPPFLNKVADVRAMGAACVCARRVRFFERERERERESMGGDVCSQCACAGRVICAAVEKGLGDTQLERWRGTRPERDARTAGWRRGGLNYKRESERKRKKRKKQ